MIVPMTSYSILVYHRDFASFMTKLQEKGLLDIRQDEVYGETSDEEFYPALQRTEKVLQALKPWSKKLAKNGKEAEEMPADTHVAHPEMFLEACEAALSDLQYNAGRIKDMEDRCRAAQVWGDFDIRKLELLQKEAAIRLVAAKTSEKNIPDGDAFQEAFPVQVVGYQAGEVYFVWVEAGSETFSSEVLSARAGFPITLAALPEKPYPLLEREYTEIKAEYDRTESLLYGMAARMDVLRRYKADRMNKLSYKTVSRNVPRQAEGMLMRIEGFLPTEQTADFEDFLEKEDVIYRSIPAEDLPDEDTSRIPVLLRNNRFAKLFEPITLLFSLPNYRELDLTPMLAPFFMAFFGFCLGDAGYGLLLMAAALFIVKKYPKAKPYGWLAFWFGLATVVFGTLSGTFFGISLVNIEALGQLRSYVFDSGKMMTLSLVIGGVQILFGMLMNVIRITKMKGFKYALYKVGWLAVIVCGGLLVGAPMLGLVFPAAVIYGLEILVVLGALLALFYNNPDKNPIFNLGLGLWDTYNTATGLVGDLLSYIRLFALGLTGGILGSVFNTLALDAANGVGVPVVSQLIMLFILLFGHSLNLALCVLGSVVHPLRLTFVEFYKNAGFAGGGKAYSPFKINR